MKQISYLLLILLSTSFIGCSGEETDNAQLDAEISPIIPKVNSTVLRVLVDDNQLVQKGDTLLVLDNANFAIAVKQAEVALALAKQNVTLSKSSQQTAASSVSSVAANSAAVQATLASAQAGVDVAKTKLTLVSKNFERIKNLLGLKSATQQQFDAIKADRDDAQLKLTIAEAQVLALNKQIDAAKYEVATTKSSVTVSANGVTIAELSIKQAENNLDMAKLQLSYCVITAPANGIVSKKNVQNGQVVSIGQPLMAIADNKKVWVVANFKETQIENMKVNQEAEIKVDAYSDKVFKGKVESFSQATGAKFSLLPADNATGNFVKVTQRIPVKITIDNTDTRYPLRAGMSVLVKVQTK